MVSAWITSSDCVPNTGWALARHRRQPHLQHRAITRNDSMDLTDLPFPIFLDIVLLLPPRDSVRCRQVSSRWRCTLMRQDLAVSLILAHFPRAREGRMLRHWLAGGNSSGDDDAEGLEEEYADWAAVFARLARRYFHLEAARPWKTSKVQTFNRGDAIWGVTPWNRFLKLRSRTADFESWDPVWTFAPESGLLVYPVASQDPSARVHRYWAHDLETGREFVVPFDAVDKMVRRVRLHDDILLFEWCEEHALHPSQPAGSPGKAICQYATAFDVVRHGPAALLPRRDAAQPRRHWSFARRAEWEMHCMGMLLDHQQHRFFSAHNRTHYAVYVWQPARSPWGDDDPMERLTVWELGPTPLPSESGAPDPDPDRPESAGVGPRVILRLDNTGLRAWGVAQRDTPSLRGLVLDETTWDAQSQAACGHVYFVEETHRWVVGPHSSPTLPPLHRVRSTGITLGGHGPRWLSECDAKGRSRRLCATSETSPAHPPCWRHDDFPFVTVSSVHDVAAGVHFSARQCFHRRTLSVRLPPGLRQHHRRPRADDDDGGGGKARRIGWEVTRAEFLAIFEWSDAELEDIEATHRRVDGPVKGSETQFASGMWSELLGKGFICGNERWLVGEDTEGDITIILF
ncbi:hypothetical protein EDB81DRAFT_909622 [Dactylonectria macrodidyma]|uniref:F-box domain-containing protein n=1 Tax=Dactylonectria macrodidyma TaxID=307937 RepID=A0A9P9JH51_9HYPO|nr:hypothetical protein EDB81DRAFT_909622 [Dactylonectria macrodidyma]